MRYTPMELAEAFLKTGELQDALDALNQQVQDHPDDPIGRRLRAQLLTRLGQPEAALDDLTRLAEHTTDDILLQARLYEALHQPDKALATLRNAHTHHTDPRLTERLWQVLTQQHHWQEAAQLAQAQGNDWRWQQLQAQALLGAGQIAEAVTMYEASLGSLQAKLPTLKDIASAHAWQGQLLIALAGCYVQLRDWQKVQATVDAASSLTQDPIVLFYRGLSMAALGALKTGIQHIQTALQASSVEVRAALMRDIKEYEFLQEV